MYVEMVCGYCDSYFNCDAEEDDSSALWLMMHRFSNAHVECGYMTPNGQEDDDADALSGRRKVIKPRLKPDLGEDSEGA